MPKRIANEDVFCIPYQQDQYLIYFPFKQIILTGNTALVNLIHKAINGEPGSIAQLGLSEDFFFSRSKHEIALKTSPAAKGISPFEPTSISLFLTNNCPLRCLYCYAEGGKNKLQMPFDMATGLLDEVVENAVKAGKKQITINYHGGGDVTAAWNLLVSVNEYAIQKTGPLGIRVNTSIGLSGVLNERQREWIIQNMHNATVSLDGDEASNRHRILANGKPSFPFVHETLKKFDKASYSYGLRCTVTEETVTHLEEIVQFFCDQYTVKNIKVEPMFPSGRAPQSGLNAPSAVAFVENFRKAKAIAKSNGRNLIYSGARFETLTNIFCQASGDSCAVTPEGWITSCYEVLDLDNPHAKVFFYGKFNAASRKMEVNERIREKLFDFNVLNRPSCHDCFCKWHCAGDCPAKVLESEQLPEGTYPDRCFINRELTKDQLIDALHD